MQTSVPKQFLPLKGKPLLIYSIAAFQKAVPGIKIILVLSNNAEERLQELRKEYDLPTDIAIVHGGNSRFASVKNALESVDGEGLLAIHDAARPFVSAELISEAFKAAEKFGSAVPVLPLTDSLIYSDAEETKSLNRENYFLVQTPQCFHLSSIKEAYATAFQSQFTDDAAVWEAAGLQVHVIPGEPKNFKITRMIDYWLAEKFLEK